MSRLSILTCALFVLGMVACDGESQETGGDLGLIQDMSTSSGQEMSSAVGDDGPQLKEEMGQQNLPDISVGVEDMASVVQEMGVEGGDMKIVVGELQDLPLKSSIQSVQPMTGLVLWDDAWNDKPLKTKSGSTQLEFMYIAPRSVVGPDGSFDWSSLDARLDAVARRGHQAIVRFYYTYPGRQTAVPDHIKALGGYKETKGKTEGKDTWFPDWSSKDLEAFHLAFYTEVAKKYDRDPRLAFLQVGFGLWGEYHIYDGPRKLGEQFPSKAFQERFLGHMKGAFKTLTWSVSIDAGSEAFSVIGDKPGLRRLDHGLFDDSFMHKEHDQYNESMWDLFGHSERYHTQPHGGELSYYTDFDQKNVLNPQGIHGRAFEMLGEKFHITYMIGNDQPNYQPDARLIAVSKSMGYRFVITSYQGSAQAGRVVVENQGIAPIYYDAWVSLDGTRSQASLKGLLPGDSITIDLPVPTTKSTKVTIESDRLVAGQTIEFEANL